MISIGEGWPYGLGRMRDDYVTGHAIQALSSIGQQS